MGLSRKKIFEMIEKHEVDDEAAYELLRQLDEKARTLGFNEKYSQTYRYDEPYLRDHTVFDERVLLGVTQCSLAINAVRALLPERRIDCLHRVLFSNPVVLQAGEAVDVTVQVNENDSGIFFKSFSQKRGTQSASETAAGEYKIIDVKEKKMPLLEKMGRIQGEYSAELLYSGEKDIVHGTTLQTVRTVSSGDGWSISDLSLSDEMRLDGREYHVHPALLDGAILGSLFGLHHGVLAGKYIPLMIQNVILYAPLGSECVCYAEMKKANEEIIVYSCFLCDQTGRVLIEMEDVTLKQIKSKELLVRSETTVSQESVHPAGKPVTNVPKVQIRSKGGDVKGQVKDYLLSRIRPLLPEGKADIDDDRNFMDLGIDSSQLISLVQTIEKDIKIELYPTLFFEHKNLGELTAFFAVEHKDAFIKMFGGVDGESESLQDEASGAASHQAVAESVSVPQETSVELPVSDSVISESPVVAFADEDVAIIGMSGVFAGSRTLDEFWNNIRDKKDLIRDIPEDHFDYRPWFDPNMNAKNKMYCKWGSFIDDVDKFDAAFFNMAPREAERMDPQLRYLLQVLYWTAEDAGLIAGIRGTNTGVYVGVCFHDYQQEMDRHAEPVEPHDGTGNAATMLANRPSFYLDLRGPSLSVDTACSSSLMALHIARRALQQGECEMAFVAGVNLLLGSWHYRYFCSIGALSSSGRCHTFDRRADGYVPGEGVAAVLLKPLHKALRDNDNIYAIIKGSAINHGGYTPSITAPSVQQEAEVITRAWKDAGINPETLGYIEAHGTGTKLGDPIEINSLETAFQAYTKKVGFCAVGSAKAHIGHLEGAAGVAGLIKTVLSMRHGMIPAMPKFEELNPYIKLDGSPIYINREPLSWNPPENGIPRRAGLSSFGFGGAYAHIVVEEYMDHRPTQKSYDALRLIPLSAKNDDRLREKAEQLIAHIGTLAPKDQLDGVQQAAPSSAVDDIAYTLQVGREPMRSRLAVVVGSLEELEEKLSEYVNGNQSIDGVYTTEWTSQNDSSAENHRKRTVSAGYDVYEMAKSWVAGAEADWNSIYSERSVLPRRISLPGYPFNGRRYRVMEPTDELGGGAKPLHEFLDENVSTLRAQRYRKSLNGSEYFLRDHVVNGSKVLPGVVYLEMARLASEFAGEGNRAQKITDVVWLKPVVVGKNGIEVHLSLQPVEGGVEYEVRSGQGDDNKAINCQGKIIYQQDHPASTSDRIDLNLVRGRCSKLVDHESCYHDFDERGLMYGPSFQGIRELRRGDGEAVAEIELPQTLKVDFQEYVLHPSLMDAALQSVVGVMDNSKTGTYVPFSLGEVEILRPMEMLCYAYVRAQGDSDDVSRYFDIDILNGAGEILIRMKHFGVRLYGGDVQKNLQYRDAIGSVSNLLYLDEAWVEADSCENPSVSDGGILFIGNDESICARLQESLGKNRRVLQVRSGKAYKALETDVYEIRPDDENGYRKLVKDLIEKGLRPNRIAFLWDTEGPGGNVSEVTSLLNSSVYAVYGLTRALVEEKPKDEVRIICVNRGVGVSPHVGALAGFGRSANFENPNIRYKIVSHLDAPSVDGVVGVVVNELACWGDEGVVELKFETGKRYVRKLQERESPAGTSQLIKDGGVYLLTGGMGGLGAIFSRHLAKQYKARIILSDVRELDDRGASLLEEIEALGGEGLYVRCDVTKREDVKNLVESAKARFGCLNGIIHAAGAIRDSFIVRKKREEMELVLNAKILGAVNLDAETSQDELDVFMTFASIAGVMGNAGQSDYAYANRFLDCLVEWREGMRAGGKRRGRTISLEWPLWDQGGMMVGDEVKKWLKETLGLELLPTEEGLQAFDGACSSDAVRIMVIYGNVSKMRKTFGVSRKLDDSSNGKNVHGAENAVDEVLFGKLRQDVVRMVASIIKVDEADIDVDAEMSEYGFDSITVTELMNELNAKFHTSLTPAIFFEHGTIASMVKYLIDIHRANLSEHYKIKVGLEAAVTKKVDASPVAPRKESRFVIDDDPLDRMERIQDSPDPIAIVGVNGIFPKSNDLEEFWDHLKRGDDLVSEIPPDRWDWRDYDGDPATEGERTRSRWGGFMKEVDKFDAAFFSIAPHEAELMDPQQRIFLEVVWKAIEDAGYAPSSLSGSKTGLFVGVSTSNYHDLLLQSGADAEAHGSTGNAYSILPNRISYLLNLHGPSEPIDTACSSSLVALHRAIRSIQDGDCDMALAGGVSVILTPRLHISFGKAGMLSDDGRCKTFDKRANGYVRGEGVGAVLLKKLSQAIEDGDHIYGIVRATAENHGGHVSSLTVPNPLAQAEVLQTAYERAKVEPWRIGLIECHGTGTALGDPVEVNALKRAFAEMYTQCGREFSGNAYCGLSAVKTNIGHLEAAAGIASMIKVILSLQHGEIPGLVHFSELNPYIDLSESPFYIVDKTREWKRFKDESGHEMPRVAGVSSFGFGGANAHAVIEEYLPEGRGKVGPQKDSKRSEVVLLSARDRERLKVYAHKFLQWLEKPREGDVVSVEDDVPQEFSDELRIVLADLLDVVPEEIGTDDLFSDYGVDEVKLASFAEQLSGRYDADIMMNVFDSADTVESLANALYQKFPESFESKFPRQEGTERMEGIGVPLPDIRNIAYTLQVGRDAMNERLAIVVSGVDELRQKLREFLDGKTGIEGLHTGNMKNLADKDVAMGQGEDDCHYVRDLFLHGNMNKLAALWASGSQIDWGMLYEERQEIPQRISLPTYPFKRERYWVPESVGMELAGIGGARLHDLLDSNESTIDEQCYRKMLTGDEYYLRDHVVSGAKILPGAAYLEMTRVAAEYGSGGRKMQRAKDVQWQQALQHLGEKTEVRVSLFPVGEYIEFEVSSRSGNGHGDNIHALGSWEPFDDKAPPSEQVVDLQGVRARCSKRLSAEQCYQMFSEIGLLYGPSFQVIRELQYGADECLAVLELPVELRDKVSRYVLHPTLLDGAFQSVVGLMLDPDEKKLFVPFSVQELTISRPLQSVCYAFARRLDDAGVGVREFDIALVDQHGRVLVSIDRFAVHEVRMNGRSPHRFMPEDDMLKMLQSLEDGQMSEDDVLSKLGIH